MIECIPLRATMSAQSCAKRYSEAQRVGGRLGSSACNGCHAGLVRAKALGLKTSHKKSTIERRSDNFLHMRCAECDAAYKLAIRCNKKRLTPSKSRCPGCRGINREVFKR